MDAHSSDLPADVVVSRGNPDYETRRRELTWNDVTPQRYPNMIVAARDVADVEKAVRFAKNNGMVVAAKSGGHSHIGSSIRDDAVVIDVSALNSVEVDPVARTAKVGPGVKSNQLIAELAPHALAFPVGHCGGTGMGGYLLGGGLGLNWNSWGPACYSVTALDVIGEDGSVRTINDETDRDLMWLARGCGPSFPGVITAYHLDVKPLPPAILASVAAVPLDAGSDVAAWFDEVAPTLPTTVETGIVLSGPVFAPQAPPDERYLVIISLAFEQDAAAAEAALRPLLAPPAQPVFADAAIRPFGEIFPAVDLFLPPGRVRLDSDSIWTDDTLQTVVELLEDHMKSSPSPLNNIMCYQSPRIPIEGNACFSMMKAQCTTFYGIHATEDGDQENTRWVQDGMALLEPITEGYWVNEADLTADPGRARRSFTPEVWQKARQVRSHYDSKGLFADYLRSDS